MTAHTTERKTALVTGISGQDGSYLADLLLEKGYIVHGASRRVTSGGCIPHLQAILADGQLPHSVVEGGQKLFLHSCDVVDYSAICELIRSIKPQEIYNLAAQSHVGLSFKEPELTAAASGLGVINILEAILEAGLGKSVRFFEASSCEMFGKGQDGPCNEESTMRPQTPYGKAKLLAHLALKHYRQAHQLYACSGILFNHESSRRVDTFVTRKITKAVANIVMGKQEILSLGNLDATKDWGHAQDYVRCMWLMLQQQQPADFVIGTGVNTTVRQFVELAFKRVGMPIRWQGPKGLEETGVVAEGSQVDRTVVTISPHFFRPVEGNMTSNPSKARVKLGWQQSTTLKILVDEMVDADLATIMIADDKSL